MSTGWMDGEGTQGKMCILITISTADRGDYRRNVQRPGVVSGGRRTAVLHTEHSAQPGREKERERESRSFMTTSLTPFIRPAML